MNKKRSRFKLEIAQRFFDDLEDCVARYDKTAIDFAARKSECCKCFIDLRIAYECALKSALAYELHDDMDASA